MSTNQSLAVRAGGDTLMIGDKWRPAGSGAERETIDPALGTPIARFAVAGQAEVDEAVAAARQAFVDPAWRALTPAARARLLWRLGDLIEAHGDELADLETRDQGQPRSMARGNGVPMAAELMRYAAGWCTKLDGDVAPVSLPNAMNYTTREPIGVCGLLSTWNFPLMSAAGKLAPALAAGNTAVIKPADHTPLTAIRLVELSQEAGFPPGVINLVTGDVDTSRAVSGHPGVDMVSFTGSTAVGRDIAERTASRFVRLSLEMGGKNPSIVTAKADIEQAALGNLNAATINSGQVCASYTRFYVHSSKVDEFVSRMAEAAPGMRIGPGTDPETQLGPLVAQRQVERVEGYVRGATEQGAELVCGGSRPENLPETGAYFSPTIFTGVTDEMTIAQEEIFGPVLAVMSYDDLDEAIARANGTPFALSAAVWTRDIAEAHTITSRLEAGGTFVNMFPALDAAVPWGGFGASGIGKEMGTTGIEDYTREKSTWIGLT